MLNILKSTTKALYTLLQSWGAVQYAVRLYNVPWDNIGMVNPLHY